MTRRFAANSILTSVGIFIALVALSMAMYPGGSWFDLQAPGHDFLRNFLCDLLEPIAHNGAPNPVGSVATPIAMIALTLGLGLTWWFIPTSFPERRGLTVAIRWCGIASVIGLMAVPLTPAVNAYGLHAIAVFAGAVPGLAAAILSVIGLTHGPNTRVLAVLGALAIGLGLLDVALYGYQLAVGGAPTIFLPGVERLATAILLSWLTALAFSWKKLGFPVQAEAAQSVLDQV